jgi:hypothetical protein
MAASSTVKVKGLREMQRAAKAAGKETSREVRKALRDAAVPVQQTALRLAATDARAGTKWSRMRIGVSARKVYVAPAARRTVGTARPNFGGRLLGRAMMPALEQEQDDVMRRMEKALDNIADAFTWRTL